MDTTHYLNIFQKSLDAIDKKPFTQAGLDLKVGIWLDSVVLKIQNKVWLGSSDTIKQFQTSVFFSIWINDDTLAKDKLYYNIHALKMRELKGYNIQSRDFAEAFRDQFKPFQSQWPNVSVDHGPLTLMEGWLSVGNFETIIPQLAVKFLDIAPIIDGLLAERKKL